MLHNKPQKSLLKTTSRLTTVAISIVLVGCAQTKPDGYYNPPAQGTLSDAQRHAMGSRSSSRAPSQLQIGFGESNKTKEEAAAQAAKAAQASDASDDSKVSVVAISEADYLDNSNNRALAKPLLKARTFLGTLPCTDSANCQANRITVTFAPNGEWRARIQSLENNQASRTNLAQGCWNVTGQNPIRIGIQSLNNAITASFIFENNNVMRLTNYNDANPKLSYRLTRQAEIDPIQELSDAQNIDCN